MNDWLRACVLACICVYVNADAWKFRCLCVYYVTELAVVTVSSKTWH